MLQLSQLYMTTGKTIALTIRPFVGRVMSLLFNTMSRFVIAFLPSSNRLLISWLQSSSTVILEHKKRKSITASTFSPSICHEVMGPDAMILVFLILSFKPDFSLSSFTLIKRFFRSSSLSAIRAISSSYLKWLTFWMKTLRLRELVPMLTSPSSLPSQAEWPQSGLPTPALHHQACITVLQHSFICSVRFAERMETKRWRERRKKRVTEKAETWGERKEGEGQNGQSLSQLGWLTPLRASLPTCDLWKPSPFSLSCSGDACFYASLRTSDA